MLSWFKRRAKKNDGDKTLNSGIPSGRVKKGDIIRLGTYPQGADGKREEIEWQVLDVIKGRALLLSKKILDMKPFHEDRECVSWHSSSVREWLNKAFLLEAFTEEERARLAPLDGEAGPAAEILWKMAHQEVSSPDLTDRVFLLRVMDVAEYYPGEKPWACPGASAKMTDWVKKTYDDPNPSWWLRTSMPEQQGPMGPVANIVSPANTVGFSIVASDNLQGIRPAIFLKTDLYKQEKAPAMSADFRVSINGQKLKPSNDGALVINCNAGTTKDEIVTIVKHFGDALSGNLSAINAIGSLYKQGRIVMQDEDLASFFDCLAAKAGQPEAQTDWTDTSGKGVGVARDEEKGEERNPNENNGQDADCERAQALMARPDRASKKEGLALAVKAAEAGTPKAMEILCYVYLFGCHGKDDLSRRSMKDFMNPMEGSKWVLMGSQAGAVLCQALMAHQMLQEGNTEDALEWALEAAKQDHAFGSYVCGRAYEQKGDLKEALTWYQKAVALGDGAAEADVKRLMARLQK